MGRLSIGGDTVCDTLENAGTLIPPGSYQAQIDFSPRLQYRCPHLRIPERDQEAGGDAGIRVHIANFADQVDGCIAVGTRNGGTLSYSRSAFVSLMARIPQDSGFTVTVA